MLMGLYAARKIIGEGYDVWPIKTNQDYLDEA